MDVLDRFLAERRALAKEALLAELRKPSCGTCGHSLEVGAWRTPAELRAKVFGQAEWKHGESATIQLALHELEDEGLVEYSPKHQVRLAGAS